MMDEMDDEVQKVVAEAMKKIEEAAFLGVPLSTAQSETMPVATLTAEHLQQLWDRLHIVYDYDKSKKTRILIYHSKDGQWAQVTRIIEISAGHYKMTAGGRTFIPETGDEFFAVPVKYLSTEITFPTYRPFMSVYHDDKPYSITLPLA